MDDKNSGQDRELQERVVNSADNPQYVKLTLTQVRVRMNPRIPSRTPNLRELELGSERTSLLMQRTMEKEQVRIQSVKRHILSTFSGVEITTVPNVQMDSIVGLMEVKQEIMSAMKERGGFQRLLLFGASGSGKALLARAVATELSTNFISFSRVKFLFEWMQNMEIFTQVLCEICKEQSSSKNSVLFLSHVDVYSTEEHSGAFGYFLRKVQTDWCKWGMKLAIIGTTFQPKEIPKSIVGHFNKRIYVPTLNFYERRELLLREIPKLWNAGHNLTVEEINGISKDCFSIVAAEINTLIGNACRVQNPKAIMSNDDEDDDVSDDLDVSRPLLKSDFDSALKLGFLRLDAETFADFQIFHQGYEEGKLMSMEEREYGVIRKQDGDSYAAALLELQVTEESWLTKLLSWL